MSKMSITDVCDLLTSKYQPNQAYALPHIYSIPVEWAYDSDENIGGDFAKATVVIVSKRVTKMACECGRIQDVKK